MINITILTDVPQNKKCGATSRVKAIKDFLESTAGINCGITNEAPKKTDVLIVCRARMHQVSLSCDAKLRILDVDNETDFDVRLADCYDHFAFITYQDFKKSRAAIMAKGFLMPHPIDVFSAPRIQMVDWEYTTVGVFTESGKITDTHPAAIYAKENNYSLKVRAKNSLDNFLDYWYSGIDYLWIDEHPPSGVSIKGIEARARGIPPIGSAFADYGYFPRTQKASYYRESVEVLSTVANQTPYNCFYNLLDIILSVK